MGFLVQFLIKMVSTQVAKTAIALAINKLLDSTEDGITKDVAIAMLDGIAKSRANPVATSQFLSAYEKLKD